MTSNIQKFPDSQLVARDGLAPAKIEVYLFKSRCGVQVCLGYTQGVDSLFHQGWVAIDRPGVLVIWSKNTTEDLVLQ